MTGWTGVLPREVRALEEVSGNWAEWARYGQMTWTRLHGINVSRRPLELCTSGRPYTRSKRVTADLKGRDRCGPLRGCLPEIRYTD